jgi:predicted RNase H-like HicB family nuclease
MRKFTAYVEWDPETKLYVGIVPGITGAHTQGATLDELQKNLKEVLELCLEEYKGSLEDLPIFVGLQQIEICRQAHEKHHLIVDKIVFESCQ